MEHYAAPKAAVDDGMRERGSWRNATIAFVAGLAGVLGLATLGFLTTGNGWSGVEWRWQAVAMLVGPALPAAIVAWRLPRRFAWWVALLSPVAAVASFLVAALANFWPSLA